MQPIYKDVSSSNIQALAYADGKGFVEFHGGRRFAYTMPLAVFNEMASAKSIGGFFAKAVKGKYPVASTSQRCNLMSCRNDATLQPVESAGKFVLCQACSKDPRYGGIAFKPIEKDQKP